MSGPYRDGDEVVRDRLAVLGDQREAIVARRRDLEVEQVEIEREIAATQKQQADIGRSPVGEYVAVLLVALGLGAVGIVAVAALQPGCRKPKSMRAQIGAEVIRQASELYMFMDAPTTCPTLHDLMGARKIEPSKTDDPWGRSYRLVCDERTLETHVWSAGSDGVHGTADDIGNHFTERDLMRIDAMD